MKLDIYRIKFGDGLRGLVVVNENNKILASGAFRDKGDALAASNLLEMLVKRINNPDKLPPLASFDDFQAKLELEERDEAACDFLPAETA